MKDDVGLIIIDYLQLLEGDKSKNKSGNREQEISGISRDLKKLAKQLHIPIIALAQLSREVEKRAVKIPQLSDLRESGAIEQDADMVLFIWREELRSGKAEDYGRAELIIGKQRSGPTGSIVLTFLPKITKFVDGAPNQPEFKEY